MSYRRPPPATRQPCIRCGQLTAFLHEEWGDHGHLICIFKCYACRRADVDAQKRDKKEKETSCD